MTAAGWRRTHRIIPGRSRALLKSNEFIAGRLSSIVSLYANMRGSSSSSSGGNIKGRLCEQRTRLGPVTQGWIRPRGDFAHTYTSREAAARQHTAKAFNSIESAFSVHFHWAPTRATAQTDVWKDSAAPKKTRTQLDL